MRPSVRPSQQMGGFTVTFSLLPPGPVPSLPGARSAAGAEAGAGGAAGREQPQSPV